MSTSLATQLEALPVQPGVYIFKDAHGDILYVGKAKILRHRVRSYFQPGAALEPAKEQMVPQIVDIATVSCHTENEALILEANLIRQHKPPYNVVLTDDKHYLFIKVTKEELPRVYPVRRISKDGAKYFGPYSSAGAVRKTLKLLRRLFPHFGESTQEKTWLFPHPLFSTEEKNSPAYQQTSPQSSGSGAGQPPKLDPEVYQQNIKNIISFLEGRRDQIMTTLRAGMQQASQDHRYERAAIFRDQLHAIEKLEGSQKVYLPTRESFDVVSIATEKTRSAANVFAVREGKLLNKNTFLLKHRQSASATDVLRQFILQYYPVVQDVPPAILIPLALPDQEALAQWINEQQPPHFLVPQRGKKKQLVAMGELNAQQLLQTENIQFETSDRLWRATQELASAIGLGDTKLHRIETYDISNIQGTLATGSMVVFVDGKPSKQHYKKFRIRSLATPNDFAMLQEVLSRRFSKRHTEESATAQQWPLPDLIIIDGGKGQLSSALKILTELGITQPVIALAKREEEIFKPGDSVPIRLPYNSDALFLIQRMRDEAHRFTVTYHRLLRQKRQQRSILDEIPGIGPKTKRQLLNHFGSLKGIRSADPTELIRMLGEKKTKLLQEYL